MTLGYTTPVEPKTDGWCTCQTEFTALPQRQIVSKTVGMRIIRAHFSTPLEPCCWIVAILFGWFVQRKHCTLWITMSSKCHKEWEQSHCLHEILRVQELEKDFFKRKKGQAKHTCSYFYCSFMTGLDEDDESVLEYCEFNSVENKIHFIIFVYQFAKNV